MKTQDQTHKQLQVAAEMARKKTQLKRSKLKVVTDIVRRYYVQQGDWIYAGPFDNKDEAKQALIYASKNMKAFQHKLSDPLPELHDHHIFEERETRRDEAEERVFDSEDAEEWMRRSDIDQQGE